jgi:ABC-type dipeptide/oligopeptide/nickel transport system permease component
MQQILTGLFRVMPLLFGLGFLAPLLAQIIERFGWTLPNGLSPLVLGLMVGGLWGSFATLKGRWI